MVTRVETSDSRRESSESERRNSNGSKVAFIAIILVFIAGRLALLKSRGWVWDQKKRNRTIIIYFLAGGEAEEGIYRFPPL